MLLGPIVSPNGNAHDQEACIWTPFARPLMAAWSGEECLCNLQLDHDPASAFQFFSSSLHIMTTTDMLFGGGVRRCRRTRLPPSMPWCAALLSGKFLAQMSTSKSPRSMRPTGVFC